MIALIKDWSLPTDWLPSSPGAILLLLLLALAASWWLTGLFFKEQDLTTLIFRCLVSVLLCFGIGLFHRSVVNFIRKVPRAVAAETPAEKEDRLRENLEQWATPAACAACLKAVPASPGKPQQAAPADVKPQQAAPADVRESGAGPMNPAVLLESAVRGLTWMALEHRQPSPFGRNAFPHAERGTKVLNSLTVAQAQAMYDYILQVSSHAAEDAQPFMADALAYCREATPTSGAPGSAERQPEQAGENSGKISVAVYPHVEVSRPAARGRAFVVRMSPTQVRVIEAASEEEALRKAREP